MFYINIIDSKVNLDAQLKNYENQILPLFRNVTLVILI